MTPALPLLIEYRYLLGVWHWRGQAGGDNYLLPLRDAAGGWRLLLVGIYPDGYVGQRAFEHAAPFSEPEIEATVREQIRQDLARLGRPAGQIDSFPVSETGAAAVTKIHGAGRRWLRPLCRLQAEVTA